MSAETASTQYVLAANNVHFAYRRFGNTRSIPLVFHMHFRGNMDHWDPAFLNAIAIEREVIIFDNTGIGRSTGEVPLLMRDWAKDMLLFIEALNIDKIDLLGFSIGGPPVLEAALAAPHTVRKLVIAGSHASAPASKPPRGIVWPREPMSEDALIKLAAATDLEGSRKALRETCFSTSEQGKSAFDRYWTRLEQRIIEPLHLNLQHMQSGGDRQVAAGTLINTPASGGLFDRLGQLRMPVLLLHGRDDTVVPASRGWELLQLIEDAQLKVYPQSAHSFLFEHPLRVAEDINEFLG